MAPSKYQLARTINNERVKQPSAEVFGEKNMNNTVAKGYCCRCEQPRTYFLIIYDIVLRMEDLFSNNSSYMMDGRRSEQAWTYCQPDYSLSKRAGRTLAGRTCSQKPGGSPDLATCVLAMDSSVGSRTIIWRRWSAGLQFLLLCLHKKSSHCLIISVSLPFITITYKKKVVQS